MTFSPNVDETPYTSVEDLNQTIDEIIDYMVSEADSRNGFIEYDITCDELDLFW